LAQIWQPVAQHRYLLLDEPTSALDLAHQHSILKVARHFAKEQGVGVLAILHDLNLAAQYADRIAVLKAGRLLVVDTPQKVLTASCIEETFGYPVLITQHPQATHCPVVVPQLGNESVWPR
jgi:iron complex transport system ATP-binding protein